MTTSKRGFASMDKEKQRQIASLGGQAAHQKGMAHEFTPEEAREAGRKGGAAVSRNREHMASIGQKGGAAVSRNREHMANIGQKGAGSSGRGSGAGASDQSVTIRNRSQQVRGGGSARQQRRGR